MLRDVFGILTCRINVTFWVSLYYRLVETAYFVFVIFTPDLDEQKLFFSPLLFVNYISVDVSGFTRSFQ